RSVAWRVQPSTKARRRTESVPLARADGEAALTDASTPDPGSANDRAEPVPANVGQPGKRIVRFPVVAEVHHPRPPLHGGRVHEAPVSRVRRVVPVVPQDEVLAVGHGERPPVVARRVLSKPGTRAVVPGIWAPYTALFTNKKSPTRSVRSMLPEGI